MGQQQHTFYYIDDIQMINLENNSYQVILNKNIFSKKDLLYEYYDKLKFPPYFGFTWDALWDCLSYIEHIKQDTIIIYHQKFPLLEDIDLKIYLKILQDLVVDEKESDGHNFQVYFNSKDYDKIQQIIGLQ
jgi:RNAse (barnase) inhibitor barstar